MTKYNCIVVLGPTASGKTKLACYLAYRLNGEIISADSRQVYQLLNIGTGKDLHEYELNAQKIPYHLIDVVPPSEQFYLHQFIELSRKSFDLIISRKKLPVFCGGTGLYLDSLRKDFSLTLIKENEELRRQLSDLSKEELLARLGTYPGKVTTHVDLNSRKRIIRGIEVAEYQLLHHLSPQPVSSSYLPYYIGIKSEVETRKAKISQRLAQRLENGLIEEVQNLLASGITEQRLELLGLEYKHVLNHLKNQTTKDQLFNDLQTAIFQFAKRQMTWFRKMEREGVQIQWIGHDDDLEELVRGLTDKLLIQG